MTKKKRRDWLVSGTVLVRFRIEDVEVEAVDEVGACCEVEEQHLDFNYCEIVESDLHAEPWEE